MMLRVDVQCACRDARAPAASQVARWAEAAAGAVDRGEAQLCVRIVGARESARLNRRYRDRRGPTNVLSFAFGAREHTEPPLLGDVVICAPVVAREAAEQGKPLEAHYAHLVVHGVLHLLGHEHDDAAAAARMERLERRVLRGLGIADPYDSGARITP